MQPIGERKELLYLCMQHEMKTAVTQLHGVTGGVGNIPSTRHLGLRLTSFTSGAIKCACDRFVHVLVRVMTEEIQQDQITYLASFNYYSATSVSHLRSFATAGYEIAPIVASQATSWIVYKCAVRRHWYIASCIFCDRKKAEIF